MKPLKPIVRAICAHVFIPVAILAIACGGGNPADSRDDDSRTFLSLGTAPPGGAFFVVGGALAEVLNGHEQDAWNVTAEATSGSQENIRRLATGELDFALSNSSITYFGVRGTEGWDQAYPVRTVMTLAQNVVFFLTRTDSGLSTISDLRGQRMSVGPAGAGFEYFVRPLLRAHGLTYDDFTPLNATQSASVDMLADRSAAAVLIGGAVPTASITQAAASMDLLFIPFDEQVIPKLVEDYVFFERATIPANTYRGQTTDFSGLDVGSMHLITSADQGDDVVYRVAKALYESREQVMQRHAAGAAINPTNVVRYTGTEFHPGAIRYYRDIGIWPE